MKSVIRVLLVEDEPTARQGLTLLIEESPGFEVVGSFGSMEEALAAFAPGQADVALLDIELPGMSGVAGVTQFRRLDPGMALVMLTVFDDNAHVFDAICAGASGYLLKDTAPSTLLAAIREVLRGGAPLSPGIGRRVIRMFQRLARPKTPDLGLTPREMELLRHFIDGHSYKTAAEALGISEDTVRTHVRSIYEKLHVHSKSEAVARALKAGLR